MVLQNRLVFHVTRRMTKIVWFFQKDRRRHVSFLGNLVNKKMDKSLLQKLKNTVIYIENIIGILTIKNSIKQLYLR